MPFIHVRTNRSVGPAEAETIKQRLGQAITKIPGKSESWLMVGIDGDCTLYFKGTDEPAAMTQVSLYGSAPSAAMNALTGQITGILQETLHIPAGRIYVSYQCTDNWGWNGGNF